ncbi:MAG: type II toxin-antitoxin system VapC family toxin [Gammaproteobacteria bacterium]|nr:type II toxin-antitoxin system VapC family toxin [Gammaproteobacteria bacterium]
MRAVDTNILVRLLARDEPRQLAAAERFVAGGAWVSHLVLVETTWVLDAVYARTGEQIAVAIAMLLDHEQLTVQDENAVRLALEHYQRKPALGFSDCLLLEIARQAGHLPLGTFDRQLGQLPGAQRL